MTSEGKGSTEKWIEAKSARFPYAYDKGGKLKRFFGVRGIPHAVLVNPLGEVVWRGHPAKLSEADIEPHLEGSLDTPLYTWPKEAKKVTKALAKRDFEKALAEAGELEDPRYASLVQAQVDLRVASVRRLRDEADWLGVETQGEIYEKELDGLPAGEEIASILDILEDDDEAQDILDAQKAVVKLTSGKIKAKQVPKLTEKLRDLAEEFPQTVVARDVDRAIKKLPRD